MQYQTRSRNEQKNSSNGPSERDRQKKKLQQQKKNAQAHWGTKLTQNMRGSDMRLDLMFNHLGDPSAHPDPRIDPNSQRGRR